MKDKLKLIKQHKKEWDRIRLIAALKDPKDTTPIERWALQNQRCGNCNSYVAKTFSCTVMKEIEGHPTKWEREFCSPYSLCECFSEGDL